MDAYRSEKPESERKQKSMDEDVAGEIIRQHSQLAGDRSNFENIWNEIAKRITPAQLQTFNFSSNFVNPGDTKTNEIYDSTGATSLARFAGILDSLLTPRDSTWHHIMVSNKDLAKDREVKLWFHEANRLLFQYRYAPKANFSSQNQQNYEALGGFGTGGLFIDDLYGDRGTRYKHVHLGELYIWENHQGIVDGFLRYFQLTARQAYQKWRDKAPDCVMKALSRDPEKKLPFIHRVKLKDSWDPERLDFKGMPFSSHYVAVEDKYLVQEGGYRTFPMAISRYKQASNEVYGRSPAMEVLPALKTLNEQKRTMLKQGHRVVDPVLLAYDDGLVDSFSLRPGAINPGAVSPEGRPLVHTLPVGNLAAGQEMMDAEKSDIRDAFLVNLFQIVTDRPQMTATEALERAKEKGMLLAPTVGRQQSEYLGPLVERELDILMRQGVLPPLPPALVEAEGDYKIEYDSPLSRVQRSEEAAGLMRTVEMALQAFNVTQDRTIMRNFNWKVIVPEISSINGVPPEWMNDPETIAAMEQADQEAQDTQTMIQGAPAAAAMMKASAQQG